MSDISEEYLARFPSKMRECLEIESEREYFSKTIRQEYDSIEVYRLVHNTDRVDENDFLDNVRDLKKRTGLDHRKSNKIGNHAVSVNEIKNEAIKSMKSFPNKDWKAVAVGKMLDEHGPADFINGKTHHNWYLFEGANKDVFKLFSLVSYE